MGAKYAISCSSGTIALFVLYRALGLFGERVVMPSYTWKSTATAAEMASMRIAFCDCDPGTFGVSKQDAKLLMNEYAGHFAAIVAVDVFGCPALADNSVEPKISGVPVIFDSAHSFGATIDGRPIGAVGHRTYSLSPTKVLTSGEGGLITTNDSDVAAECARVRDWAGRMSEYEAASALLGLQRLSEVLQEKRAIARAYRDWASQHGVGVQSIPSGVESTFKDVCLVFKTGQERDSVKAHLEAAGIDTRIYFLPAHRFIEWTTLEVMGDLCTTEKMLMHSLCLPSWPGVDYTTVIEELSWWRYTTAETPAGTGTTT